MKNSTASSSGATARPKLSAQASSSTSKKTSTKAPQPIPTSPESLKDAETYRRLRTLGMPSAITLDEFTRLLNRATLPSASTTLTKAEKPSRASADRKSGSQIRAALECLSTHLVGRDEARRLRGCIARCVEDLNFWRVLGIVYAVIDERISHCTARGRRTSRRRSLDRPRGFGRRPCTRRGSWTYWTTRGRRPLRAATWRTATSRACGGSTRWRRRGIAF